MVPPGEYIYFHCNGGTKVVDTVGELNDYRNFGTISPSLPTSWACHAWHDSTVSSSTSRMGSTSVSSFWTDKSSSNSAPTTNGIYYHDTADRASNVLILNTVTKLQEGFTDREFTWAHEDHRVTQPLGISSDQAVGKMVSTNIIVNFLVMYCNITNAKK